MAFVYLHLSLFGFWIIANLGWIPAVPRWDESFVVLAMIASVEAIFLSTFVLISQNRMAAAADKRADLDLQINLPRPSIEVTSCRTWCRDPQHLGLHLSPGKRSRSCKRNVAPEAVLDCDRHSEKP
jgi:hypothetical protein